MVTRSLDKIILIASWIGLVTITAGPAGSAMCTLDAVPAATLLLPYFEVDLTDPDGANTLFSINNALDEPALAQVTLWTDWSVPTISFNVFLTGFDVVNVDLRDLFVNGNLPITADEQSDPDDDRSPEGAPGWDGSFDGCQDIFPFFTNPLVTGALLERVQNGHTGQFVSMVGGCMGEDVDGTGNVARGYVTVDRVDRCALFLPDEDEYWVDVAGTRNQLWGDAFYLVPGGASLSALPLVHVEADPAFDTGSTPTGETFYRRLTESLPQSDHREPLGTVWGARFLGDGVTAESRFLAWRDSGVDPGTHSFPCGPEPPPGPDWRPLAQRQVFCFDESETPLELCAGPGADCFPLATQSLAANAGALATPFGAGWCRLDLNVPVDPISDQPLPAVPAFDVRQSYVAVSHSTAGLYTSGLQAIELAQACAEQAPAVLLPLFLDGFEMGDLTAWTSSVP